MSATTRIEWTRDDDGTAGATWNPVTGCTEVSEGCDHCYARTFAERWRGVPEHPYQQGFDVRLWPERLELPLRWRKPRRVFVNSMSDLFMDANDVPEDFIASVFAVMALTTRHTFQVLTKRPGRMRSLLSKEDFRWQVGEAATEIISHTPTEHRRRIDSMVGWSPMGDLEERVWLPPWPLPNVWLGVSVENQRWADVRIPALLETPAAVRFLSCEPLLGPIDLEPYVFVGERPASQLVDWVIVGGESGPKARPMDPAWVRSLLDQCVAAGVPFFFKQWGAWAPTGARGIVLSARNAREVLVGQSLDDLGHRQIMRRAGKHAAGRELDGRMWDQFPEAGLV